MPKKPRLKGTELYHHLYAWGNDRHPIFKEYVHYEKYLTLLESFSVHWGLEIIAYALLEWHVHLFIYDRLGKLSQFINNLHGEYARYFNKDTKRVGHVFGERFNNKVVQLNAYGLWLTRYIHRQAIESGIVNDPKDYPWTSYRVYIGILPKGFLKPEKIWEQFGIGKDMFKRYEAFVLGLDDGPVDWSTTGSGVVIGDEEFIKKTSAADGAINKGRLVESDFDDLISKVSSQLGIDGRLILSPSGLIEKKLRHEAFRILVGEYGLSSRRVAQLFRVSPMTVIKAINRKGGANG